MSEAFRHSKRTNLHKIALAVLALALLPALARAQFVPPGGPPDAGGGGDGGRGGLFGGRGGRGAATLSPEQDQFLQNFNANRVGMAWKPEEILAYFEILEKYKLSEEEEMAKSTLLMGLPLTPDEQRLVDRAYRKDEISKRKQKRFIQKVKRRHERMRESSFKNGPMRRNYLAQRETDARRADRMRRGKSAYTFFERMSDPSVRQQTARNRGIDRQRAQTESQRQRQRAKAARQADRERRRHARERG